MKRILPLILCFALLVGMLSGCAAEDKPYVPHGDALMPEDTDLNAPIQEEKEDQELTLAYYADRSMNPYTSNDFTNRTLRKVYKKVGLYQG